MAGGEGSTGNGSSDPYHLSENSVHITGLWIGCLLRHVPCTSIVSTVALVRYNLSDYITLAVRLGGTALSPLKASLASRDPFQCYPTHHPNLT